MRESNAGYTKKDLENGDIIMTRMGDLGLYLKEYDVIIYQEGGYDEVEWCFNDDLSDNDMDDEYLDIMRVYHAYGPISFSDYEDNGDLVYERDRKWEPPTEEELAAILARRQAQREAAEKKAEESREKARREAEEQERKLAAEGQFLTWVMVQGFYGNRTMTQLYPKDFDAFIRGYIDFSKPFTLEEPVERTIIRIPGEESLVIIYDECEERRQRERLQAYYEAQKKPENERKPWECYEPKPLATIPEKGIKIYSRCLACRMNEEGKFESLQPEDTEKVIKYLAK